MRALLKSLFYLASILVITGICLHYLKSKTELLNSSSSNLIVMTYPGFMAEWGPGPEIAQLFEKEFHIHIQYIDGGEAGVLLHKLKILPTDVVLGLDQLSLLEAIQNNEWYSFETKDFIETQLLNNKNSISFKSNFQQIDWAPLGFNFRNDEIPEPQSLEDLLNPIYQKQLSLPDPRFSSTGMQFLFWILTLKSLDNGFEYLEKLKPQIYKIANSWSTSYGLFKKSNCKLTFSYFTSPLYHLIAEKDQRYRFAHLKENPPIQIEYAGIPKSTHQAQNAVLFVHFLLRPEIQKIIMQKNFMLPVIKQAVKDTEFEGVYSFDHAKMLLDLRLLENKVWILKRWQELEL